MAYVGVRLPEDRLVLTRGRDFRWVWQFVDVHGKPIPAPEGRMFVELLTEPITVWLCELVDEFAIVSAPAEEADKIEPGTGWQLVYFHERSVTGGDPAARGKVKVQR